MSLIDQGEFCFLLFWDWKSKGKQNIPTEGPIIVAAKHVSIWDPIVVALVLDRPVHFMAKAELFNYAILGQIIIKN